LTIAKTPALRRLALTICQFAVLCLSSATCCAEVRVEAYRGEPFGIGRVTIDLPQGVTAAGDDRFGLAEADNRLLYPVLNSGRAVPG
jgi:hypothetical protein